MRGAPGGASAPDPDCSLRSSLWDRLRRRLPFGAARRRCLQASLCFINKNKGGLGHRPKWVRAIARLGFSAALRRGLAKHPRSIPCQFLYDSAGSALFERITTLESYYLTRAETALLHRSAPMIAALIGPGARVVEPGAGAMVKTRVLLRALDRPAAYVPVDVAGPQLRAEAGRLAMERPDITITPVEGDFRRAMPLPPGQGPVVVFFPGSTLGNLPPAEAVRLLARMAELGDWVLVGVDPVCSPRLLVPAYADADGVTARFMRNVLVRANCETGATFRPEYFDHRVRWNPTACRVEHRLTCRRPHTVRAGGRRIHFRRGDAIHVEDCHKYPPAAFRRLAAQAGLVPAASWQDADGLFSLHLLRPAPPAAAR
jgi:L-histidine Nalpha-methyltransferase